MTTDIHKFETRTLLSSPRINNKTKDHVDFVLNSRKPTIPKPFYLNTLQRSINLHKSSNFRVRKQKNHSISPLVKKNLYGSLSPSSRDYLITPDSTTNHKSLLKSKVSLKLKQKKQPYDSRLIDTRPITKDEFYKYKVSLKLIPKLNLNKQLKWAPKIKLEDLINFH